MVSDQIAAVWGAGWNRGHKHSQGRARMTKKSKLAAAIVLGTALYLGVLSAILIEPKSWQKSPWFVATVLAFFAICFLPWAACAFSNSVFRGPASSFGIALLFFGISMLNHKPFSGGDLGLLVVGLGFALIGAFEVRTSRIRQRELRQVELR
jgi:hypothetical protein